MRIKTRKDQAAEDAETVARVRDALESYLAGNGPGVSVSAAHVLDLLNPRGLWVFDPEYRKAAQQQEQKPVPGDTDPITGCRPVTPQG